MQDLNLILCLKKLIMNLPKQSSLSLPDRTIDNWLAQNVAPIYDATKDNPARGVSAASVRERLAKEHSKQRNAK